MQVTSQIETITPAQARTWLETSCEQQRIRRKHQVEFLSRQMKGGHWRVNGESIKLSENGRLIDGQHRLSAIVSVGKAMKSFVTRGLPEHTFSTIDIGSRRTVADTLRLNGEKNYALLAAAINVASALAHPKPFWGLFLRMSLSPSAAEEFVERNLKIRESVNVAVRDIKGVSICHPSVVAAIHYEYTKRNWSALADLFASGMQKGFNSRDKIEQPLHVLRETMILSRMRKETPRRDVMVAMCIIAMNASINVEKIESIKINKNAPFPTIA